MHLSTQAERDLYAYLSPEHKAEVEEHYAALEADDIDESANDGIGLGEEAIELMVRPMSMLEPYDYKLDR
jgi:hypothetical protein